jgi:hypothetical protein
MTVSDLRRELAELPGEYEVLVSGDNGCVLLGEVETNLLCSANNPPTHQVILLGDYSD